MVMDFLPPATQDHLVQKNIKQSEEILPTQIFNRIS